jgi:glyoxylase I family protein
MEATFHHFGIVVPDLEKASLFYQQALGFEELYRFDWKAEHSPLVERVIDIKSSAAHVVMLEGAGCHLELFEYSAPEPRGDPKSQRASDTGIAHLAFSFDDIDAAWQRFKDAGGVMHGKPVRLGRTMAIYCRDPFGNIIELMQPLDEGSS